MKDNLKILFIHNDYRSPSGEEHSAEKIADLLTSQGHEVQWFRKSSKGIDKNLFKKFLAFLSGIYNPFTSSGVRKKIKEFKPDVVQIQNIYPFISPSVFRPIQKAGIPIVMRCPNYRLFCPSGLHLDNKGSVCEKCLGKGREIHGFIKNCESDYVKSLGYALRNFMARKVWKIQQKVDTFIVQSDFQKRKFVENGIPASKISILSGFSKENDKDYEYSLGEYVTFIGRVSKEKGIVEFLKAAEKLPDIPFMVAGKLDSKDLTLKTNSPNNVIWRGFITGPELELCYSNSRIVVIPGKWFEGFPNVIINSMEHRKPVITSRLGAMASIVDDNKNGILVTPGNTEELMKAINDLYKNEKLCKELGNNGFKKSKSLYASNKVYDTLLLIYNRLINNNS